jgi:hypothetical protein
LPKGAQKNGAKTPYIFQKNFLGFIPLRLSAAFKEKIKPLWKVLEIKRA